MTEQDTAETHQQAGSDAGLTLCVRLDLPPSRHEFARQVLHLRLQKLSYEAIARHLRAGYRQVRRVIEEAERQLS